MKKYLAALHIVQRWGRVVYPFWKEGAEITAPAPETNLVAHTVSTGKKGYIYGFFISAQEGNDFKLVWTSGGTTYSRRIILAGKGSVQYVDFIALNEGLPADPGSVIAIQNVNAGSLNIIYQASILIGEV
ncbi:MAG: hypothetical protein QXR81_08330 [Candidatus Nezhaarchaeales archaeon]